MKLTPKQRDAILMEYYEGIVYHSDEDTTKKLRHDRVEQFAIRCAEILHEKELKELKKYRERNEEEMAYHGWSKSHETK